MYPSLRFLAPALLTLVLAAPAAAFEPPLAGRPEASSPPGGEPPAVARTFREANAERLRANVAEALEEASRSYRLELTSTPLPSLDAAR